ncbi:hypothetical protein PGIGA_G00217710 [Pangasianodon gigas]|uniref:Uncharacterized protein n=1 Tax=Pangasianodon gigas TaxID=30993 RepID=A0ACC5WJR9_PANGG|nr:hypothetical protein [Pangasianodon gigas]
MLVPQLCVSNTFTKLLGISSISVLTRLV